MISKTLQDAFNAQINRELYSSYLYLSMAAYFENKNLSGFAKWMHVQDGEERAHAMRLYQFVVDRGGRVMLEAIAAPDTEWKTSLDLFKQVAEHEARVTACITELYELALKEKDYAAQMALQWFITEQVEEEKNAAEIVQQLELVEARGTAVLMLDHQLGKRGA